MREKRRKKKKKKKVYQGSPELVVEGGEIGSPKRKVGRELSEAAGDAEVDQGDGFLPFGELAALDGQLEPVG